MKISSIVVAFLENMNFKQIQYDPDELSLDTEVYPSSKNGSAICIHQLKGGPLPQSCINPKRCGLFGQLRRRGGGGGGGGRGEGGGGGGGGREGWGGGRGILF